MPKVKDETRYKRKIREACENAGMWTEAYEPAMGSGTGYPDIQVLSPDKILLPVELKIGKIVENRVFPREVRGDQVVWHRKFAKFGGISVCLIGVETAKDSNKWMSYAVSGEAMVDWKDGFLIKEIGYYPLSTPEDMLRMVNFFLCERYHPLPVRLGA